MSTINPEPAFERLIDLVVHQDRQVQYWAGRFIVIHTALATAASVLLGWRGREPTPFLVAGVCLISLVGIVFAFLLVAILRRHLAWQSAYVERVRQLEGPNEEDRRIFRTGMVKDGSQLKLLFSVARWVVAAAWLAFAVFVVIVKVLG